MIRRDEPADGAPSHWALISQVEHARLAGRLAEPWVDGPFAPLWPRDELLWAIEHHDDGWRQWEACPGVDSRTGRPRNFTEMPAAEALAIWRHSVDAAAAAFPLAGYVVAGHFCAGPPGGPLARGSGVAASHGRFHRRLRAADGRMAGSLAIRRLPGEYAPAGRDCRRVFAVLRRAEPVALLRAGHGSACAGSARRRPIDPDPARCRADRGCPVAIRAAQVGRRGCRSAGTCCSLCHGGCPNNGPIRGRTIRLDVRTGSSGPLAAAKPLGAAREFDAPL